MEGLLACSDAELAAHLALLCTHADVRTRIQRHNATVRPAYDWSDVLWRTEYAYDAAADLAAGPQHTVPAGTSHLARSRRDRSPTVAAREVEGEPA